MSRMTGNFRSSQVIAGVRLGRASRCRAATREILLVAALATGCTAPVDVIAARQIPAEARPDAAAVARANNQFACDLYAQLAASDGNLFLSPFSITTALAMADAGAAGVTDEELRTALHMTELGDRMHTAYSALLDSLAIGRDHGAYTLATANRLFGQSGMHFLPTFLEVTRRDYGAELMPVDFASDAEGARKLINSWVADNTEDKIPELFESGSFDGLTRLVLANAIAFRGTWANPFKPDLTRDEPFALADGGTVQVRMMQKRDTIATGSIPEGSIAILPFASKDLSMVIALPAQHDGLPALEAQLSGDAIAQWIDSAQLLEAEIAMPKFGFASKVELKTALESLGITSAFVDDLADFSAMNGARNLHLERVVHRATISVDEAGAEATAATGVVVGIRSAPRFHVDRPFLFWIYDHITGAVLFMGRVQDPTVTGS
jgi:serpin B